MTTINSNAIDLTLGESKCNNGVNTRKFHKARQIDIVYGIILRNQPIRTERIQIYAMQSGISSSDRRIRELQEQGRVSGYMLTGDKTKTWVTKKQGELF